MDRVYCTIVSKSFIPYARALAQSLSAFDSAPVVAFVSDSEDKLQDELITICTFNDLAVMPISHQVKAKYQEDANQSLFRWAMKPVLMSYLLEVGYKRVIFVDADICFFSSPEFLWEKLNQAAFLLTPHWRNPEPVTENDNFQLLYRDGLFNAGFVGASTSGRNILDWWCKACLFATEMDKEKGFFGDQIHLNLIPVYFEGVEIIRHQGCNVANWNLDYCERTGNELDVKINKRWPIVFIHFSNSTIRGIVRGKDRHLIKYLEKYLAILESAGIHLDLGRFSENNKLSHPKQSENKMSVLKKIKSIIRKR